MECGRGVAADENLLHRCMHRNVTLQIPRRAPLAQRLRRRSRAARSRARDALVDELMQRNVSVGELRRTTQPPSAVSIRASTGERQLPLFGAMYFVSR
jgi:hypothetical protein